MVSYIGLYAYGSPVAPGIQGDSNSSIDIVVPPIPSQFLLFLHNHIPAGLEEAGRRDRRVVYTQENHFLAGDQIRAKELVSKEESKNNAIAIT